jgi:hypothetical protein
MLVSKCAGPNVVQLGVDTSGLGRRMLAIFDPDVPTLHVIELSTSDDVVVGTLRIARTTFRDAAECSDDCDRLLQFPLPNDVIVDGYHMANHALFRYQFGRRDALMLTRYAFRKMRKAGYGPAIVLDLSQWDGKTPGTDVGKPRHHSHKRGIDIDVSLYDNAAVARLRPFCDTKAARLRNKEFELIYSANDAELSASDQLVCEAGRVHDFNAYAVGKMLGLLFQTGRLKVCFLDQQLILAVKAAARLLLRDGAINSDVAGLISDGTHLQKWPNHVDHVHVRFLEQDLF